MDLKLSVEEATNTVYFELEEFTGWKFLKSQRCIKKKIGDVEFVINFFSSKWNASNEYVGINADLRIVYKKLGKLPVQNVVASYFYHPKVGDDRYWYDISTKEKLDSVIKTLKSEIESTALQLESDMKKNYKEAVKTLFEKHYEDYDVKLEFVADVLGMDTIVQKVHSIVDALSDEEKQDISDYKNGKRTKNWMLNPTNLRFIVDNNLME
jgi:hypothetical protein